MKSKYARVEVSSATLTSDTSLSLHRGQFSPRVIEISEITQMYPRGRMSNAAINLSAIRAATESWKYASADVSFSL